MGLSAGSGYRIRTSQDPVRSSGSCGPQRQSRGEPRELNGNNITRIHKNDFAGLKQLRVLQLMENQIGAVERGAFDDMKELERLRLNRNQLHVLPELLFQNNQALSRL
ncbi:hypothetical protein ACRRTK_011817 [Alexandromys fortis]